MVGGGEVKEREGDGDFVIELPISRLNALDLCLLLTVVYELRY